MANNSKTKRIKSDDAKFWGLVIIGTIFSLMGFWAPPIGLIENSVLIWSGQCLVLAGAVLGINLHFDVKEVLGLKENNEKSDEEE